MPKSAEVGSLSSDLIASGAELAELLKELDGAERVALDTEADSLHSYREKLCLLQISFQTVVGIDKSGFGRRDLIVDPLSNINLAPLSAALEQKEIVLHGADYDLRLLRRGLNFTAPRILSLAGVIEDRNPRHA